MHNGTISRIITYIYIHNYTYVYIYIHNDTYVCIYMHACIHTYIDLYMFIDLHIYRVSWLIFIFSAENFPHFTLHSAKVFRTKFSAQNFPHFTRWLFSAFRILPLPVYPSVYKYLNRNRNLKTSKAL